MNRQIHPEDNLCNLIDKLHFLGNIFAQPTPQTITLTPQGEAGIYQIIEDMRQQVEQCLNDIQGRLPS